MRSGARLPYNGSGTISDLNRQLGKNLAAKLVPHHIRKRARCFLLRRSDVGHPLFIESDVVAVGDISKKYLVIADQHRWTRSVPTGVVRAVATSISEAPRGRFAAKCMKQERPAEAGRSVAD
jgi:hypothetical protein